MAEIRIKKKSSPVWPWIIGILIILAAVWFILEFVLTEEGIRFGEKYRIEERYVEPNGDNYPTHTKRIDDFIAMINDRSFIEESVDEEKAKDGMQLLSEALNEVVEEQDIQSQEIIADKHVLSEQVNNNELNNKEGIGSSGDINRSFYTAANLITGIQQEQYPELAGVAAEVQESAMAIEPSEDISEQGELVKDFLIKSGYALQYMRESIYGKVHQEIPEEVRLINQ
jgi:hypothetical protein